MAKGGRIRIDIDYREVERNLLASISRVERGTKKATIAACEEIRDISLAQVPEMTGTLASAFSYEILGSYRNFTARLGYGVTKDPVNPRTGQLASDYMVAVHEDLTAVHDKGKAKFLEDAIREYQDQFLPRAARHIGSELL